MNREFIEPKAYFEKPGMSWLSFGFVVASFVMAWFCLGELSSKNVPYDYFRNIDIWDMLCFAWSSTVYFKFWIGCVVLSIICNPICGGIFNLLISPLLCLAVMLFHIPSPEPLFAGNWELFGGNVIILISLVLLVFALPIILVGVSADVKEEMKKERQAEKTDSRYPFDENFARAMDGVMKS